MRSVDVGGLDIDSHDLFFGSLIVNGVDVVPFVDAELNRQFPAEGQTDAWLGDHGRGTGSWAQSSSPSTRSA
jgi:hypothetical protein